MLYSRPPNWNLKTGNGDAALRKVEQGIGFGHTVVLITVTGDGTVEAPIAASANPNSFEGKTIPEEPESMTTASAEVGPPTVGNVADVQVMGSKAICHLLEATCTLELQHRIWIRSAGVFKAWNTSCNYRQMVQDPLSFLATLIQLQATVLNCNTDTVHFAISPLHSVCAAMVLTMRSGH